MTLHAAIEVVLQNGQPMMTQQIADILNKNGLYQRRDNTPIPGNQVSARISNHNYEHLFNRADGMVSLANNE